MRVPRFKTNAVLIIGALSFLLIGTQGAWGAVMQSASWKIQSDSLNFGGGSATAPSFQLRDTLGEIATGESGGAGSYRLHAGYRQMLEIYLAMSAPPDVVLAPPLGGIVGGTSNGTTSVTVTTDNPAGYQLLIQSVQSPALQRVGGGGSIADYAVSTPPADPTFQVSSGDARFGFTVDGSDISAAFRYDGSSCGSGGDASAACWRGLSPTAQEIARSTTANHPSGAATTIHFRVGIGADAMVPQGTYRATTTLTLLPL